MSTGYGLHFFSVASSIGAVVLSELVMPGVKEAGSECSSRAHVS